MLTVRFLKMNIFGLFTAMLLAICYGSEAPLVSVKQGKIIGSEAVSENGNRYLSFKGIPYAEPPVGELRFQPPIALSRWEGTINGTENAPSCHQAALGYREGQEDCLYLSVYTPELPEDESDTLLPVLIWLHGGAFVAGSASQYDPYLVMNRKMVVVIPQYRIGLFGYYSTRSPTAIGNYGTLDQVLALKWVKENIQNFSGNPDQITLGGDCAGGVAAFHHMISPLSEGLFHRVISLSGSPLSPWALKPKHNRLILGLSNKVVCPNYDLSLLTDCFKKRSAKELMDAQQSHLETYDYLIGNDQIAPAVQVPAYVHESNLILDDYPLKILLQNKFPKVPVMLWVTRDVGAYMVDMGIYELVQWQLEREPDYLKEKFLNLLLAQLGIHDHEKEVAKFAKHYVPNWDFESFDDAIEGIEMLIGDAAYNAGIISLAKILSKNNEVRLLRFDYEGGPKLFSERHPDLNEAPPIPPNRVSHGDELFFLFPDKPHSLSVEQKQVVDNLLDILENFINGKEPIKGWPQFTPEGLETALITAEGKLEQNVRFAASDREKMLDFIFRSQQFYALQEMETEGQSGLLKSLHDEL